MCAHVKQQLHFQVGMISAMRITPLPILKYSQQINIWKLTLVERMIPLKHSHSIFISLSALDLVFCMHVGTRGRNKMYSIWNNALSWMKWYFTEKNIYSYQNFFCFAGYWFEVFWWFCFSLLGGLWILRLFLHFTVDTAERKVFQSFTVTIFFSLHNWIMCQSSRKPDSKYRISIIPIIASSH